MSSSQLLAHLVQSKGLPPEPVATDALAHILDTSEAARVVLQGIAHALCPEGVFDDLVFSGQAVATDNEGRPDLVGADASGPKLLIEAKFDAALTAPQIGTGYLDWLPEEQEGVLVYLVPANRMPALWPQLLHGPCQMDDVPPPDLAHADAVWLRQPLAGGRVVAAMSWENLVSRLHAALDGGGEATAAADLAQLDGLVQAQTRTGWIPLATGDLPDRVGPQLVGLRDAAVSVSLLMSKKKVTNATQDIGPGRWITTSSGRAYRVGLHFAAWASLGMTPLWATVWSDDPVRLHAIGEGLSDLRQTGGPGLYRVDQRTWGVPIVIDQGTELGAVGDQIAAVCSKVSDLLNALPEAVTAAEQTAADAGAPLAPGP
jgi:hypothetical protein